MTIINLFPTFQDCFFNATVDKRENESERRIVALKEVGSLSGRGLFNEWAYTSGRHRLLWALYYLVGVAYLMWAYTFDRRRLFVELFTI